jgi:hypothetical protein
MSKPKNDVSNEDFVQRLERQRAMSREKVERRVRELGPEQLDAARERWSRAQTAEVTGATSTVPATSKRARAD